MKISIKDDTNRDALLDTIAKVFAPTRFTMRVSPVGKSIIKFSRIRLAESKQFCGSHPFICDIEGGRKAKYLEGLDWVDFNDRLNDVLDRLEVSANVSSAVCILRKDKRRRTHYWGSKRGIQFEWDKDCDDSHYGDFCGKTAPASSYPEGPGFYSRREDGT